MLKILSFVLILSYILHANTLQLDSKIQGLSTLSKLSFFEDTTKKIDMEEIKNIEFQTKKFFRFNQGVSNSNWWLKFKVENTTDKPIAWVLKFNYGQFDELQSWQYSEKNMLISNFSKGDHFINISKTPFKERTAFTFNTQAKTSDTIYVKLAYANYGLIETFHNIWSKNEFLKYEEFRLNLIIGIISALCVLLFYNIFIWFILRKQEYFWYNTYLIGVIFTILTLDQVGSHYIWNKSLYIMDIMPFVSLVTLFTSFLFFTRSFLDTPNSAPRVDKVLITLIFINLLALLLGISDQRYIAIKLLHFISFSFIFFPILGFKLWYDGYKIARGYAIASLVVSITIILSILRFSEVLQTSELLFWITRFGFIVEGILLSIALADRITILEHDYIREQNKVKHTLEEAKKSLESEVKKRTNELEVQTQKAEKLARTDEMTGIYNRRAFLEEGEKLIYDAIRYKTNFSLIILDIDFFKNINDTYGHEAGDSILVSFTKEIERHLRDSDFFARIGGEEFVILLSHTNSSQAYEKANMLLKKINEMEIIYKNYLIKITASMGISECTNKDDNLDSLLAQADKALYYAKDNGRNMVCI